MKKIISHIIGMSLGALAILPAFSDKIPIFNIEGTVTSTWNLDIPIMVNTFSWVYLVMFIGLLCIYLWNTNLNPVLKIGASYMYVACFFAAAPYLSFNAMLMMIPAIYLFLLIQNMVDKEIIIDWIVALFWFEVLICVMQFLGKDKLLNFDRPQRIFLGSIMQHMRSGSLFAIIAPFLLLRNKLYIIPLVLVAFGVYSSGFALALAAGGFVYFMISNIKIRNKIIAMSTFLMFAIIHSIYNFTSFQVAFSVGRIPCWKKIWMTGFGVVYNNEIMLLKIDYAQSFIQVLKGWGLNHFMYLYPVAIGDANPFAQAHNDWLQIFWELGIIGLTLVVLYCLSLVRRLYKSGKYIWIAGLTIIAVNMMFAFPLYMPPQTPLLILTFFALCERELTKEE